MIQLTLKCSSCGSLLFARLESPSGTQIGLKVEPCQLCVAGKSRGREEGYTSGHDDGYSEGFKAGAASGHGNAT